MGGKHVTNHVEWVREIDWQFTKEERKIVLLVYSCPAQPTIYNLMSIQLIFLISIELIFSKLQPMNQGVVMLLKVHYRALSVQNFIDSIEEKKASPEFSILDAMQMLDATWGKVKTETICNCFANAGICQHYRAE